MVEPYDVIVRIFKGRY